MTANDDPERALALSYAPADRRAALRALFALDAALGQVLRTTREPMVGQMRLAWWREALAQLDTAPPPAEPVLQALAGDVMQFDVKGEALASMVDGWEELLRSSLDVFALQRHVVLRGARLFELGAKVCGVSPDRRIERIGRGWAFADIAGNLTGIELAKTAASMAAVRLPWSGWAREDRFPQPARGLSALALIARMDLDRRMGPKRVVRLAWHRMTGR